jgi:hypothetical protein
MAGPLMAGDAGPLMRFTEIVRDDAHGCARSLAILPNAVARIRDHMGMLGIGGE